jgi:hypothetical protein
VAVAVAAEREGGEGFKGWRQCGFAVAAACGVVWGGAAGLLGCCAVDWACTENNVLPIFSSLI